MRYEHSQENDQRESLFLQEIERLSGQKISLCYQCGKCLAGCPLGLDMEVPPNRIVRFVHLGLREQTMHYNTIWLCSSCPSCLIRCPQQLDLAKVMAALRELYQQGEAGKKKTAGLFMREFSQYLSLFWHKRLKKISGLVTFSRIHLLIGLSAWFFNLHASRICISVIQCLNL
jgi:heterodisulfide reductase subunit C